jgi:hypothetical protein
LASSSTQTRLFSVEPSRMPSATLTPTVVTPSARTQQRPLNSVAGRRASTPPGERRPAT